MRVWIDAHPGYGLASASALPEQESSSWEVMGEKLAMSQCPGLATPINTWGQHYSNTSPNSHNKNESHGKRDTCFTTPHLKKEVFTLEKQVSHLREEKSSRKVFTFLILEGAEAQMHTNQRDFSHNRANVSTHATLESLQWLNENTT